MRKILAAMVVAGVVAALPAAAFATTTKTASQQEELLIKKKAAEARKADEARKAADAKKAAEAKKAADAKKAAQARKLADAKKAAEAKKIADAKKSADAKKIADAKKAAEAKKIADARKAAASKKVADAKKAQAHGYCAGFLKCLLGSKPKAGVVKASTGKAVVQDQQTGEDISWADASKYKPGSLVVLTRERALYFVTGPDTARRYSVGVGREGFQWAGSSRIVSKAEWPTWHPPAEMIKREAAKGHMLPDMMEGGPENPLGARAMYIGGKIYRIHGTNAPESIGGAVSSGCIRMMNADVTELYDKVKVGAPVIVIQ